MGELGWQARTVSIGAQGRVPDPPGDRGACAAAGLGAIGQGLAWLPARTPVRMTAGTPVGTPVGRRPGRRSESLSLAGRPPSAGDRPPMPPQPLPPPYPLRGLPHVRFSPARSRRQASIGRSPISGRRERGHLPRHLGERDRDSLRRGGESSCTLRGGAPGRSACVGMRPRNGRTFHVKHVNFFRPLGAWPSTGPIGTAAD